MQRRRRAWTVLPAVLPALLLLLRCGQRRAGASLRGSDLRREPRPGRRGRGGWRLLRAERAPADHLPVQHAESLRHSVHEVETSENAEWGCFDGLIFTTDLAYVPDAGGPACDDDDLFTGGTCFGNWGPNLFDPGADVEGYCSEAEPAVEGQPCQLVGCAAPG